MEARALLEAETQDRLNEQRIAESRAVREAKKNALILKKQGSKKGEGAFAMILNKKKVNSFSIINSTFWFILF